jgi:hypothetical protein
MNFIMKLTREINDSFHINYILKTYKIFVLSNEFAAVESIVKNMRYKSFTEFMITYAETNEKFYDFIYSNFRCGHFHEGEFPFLHFNLPNRLQIEILTLFFALPWVIIYKYPKSI